MYECCCDCIEQFRSLFKSFFAPLSYSLLLTPHSDSELVTAGDCTEILVFPSHSVVQSSEPFGLSIFCFHSFGLNIWSLGKIICFLPEFLFLACVSINWLCKRRYFLIYCKRCAVLWLKFHYTRVCIFSMRAIVGFYSANFITITTIFNTTLDFLINYLYTEYFCLTGKKVGIMCKWLWNQRSMWCGKCLFICY